VKAGVLFLHKTLMLNYMHRKQNQKQLKTKVSNVLSSLKNLTLQKYDFSGCGLPEFDKATNNIHQ